MPEYLAPGVYVEEVDTGIKTIEGVSTSVAGMVGVTRRGPTRGLPQLVTSFAEYERIFGGYFPLGTPPGQALFPHAVSGFFTNGGRQLYVARVASASANAAEKTTEGGVITRLASDASHGATTIKLATLLGIENGTNLRLQMVRDGQTHTMAADATVTSINRNTNEVTFAPLTLPTSAPTFFAQNTTVFTDRKDITSSPLTNILQGPRDASVVLQAADAGAWGRDVVMTVAPQAAGSAEVDSVDDTQELITLKGPFSSVYKHAWIEFDRGDDKVFKRVLEVSAGGKVLKVDPFGATDLTPQPATGKRFITVWELKITATLGSIAEEFSGLTLEDVPGKFISKRLEDSALIRVKSLPQAFDPIHFPNGADGRTLRLDDANKGTDGTAAPVTVDYIGGGDPGDRFGLKALEDIDRISIIAAPGNVDVPVQAALIGQCETLKDRFAILDPAGTTVNHVIAQRQQFDTKYGAIYFPNLRVFDPVSGSEITVPPSGHMAGLYARVDIERGVHKAPANEVVRGITNFALTVNKETHDLLNPSPTNINVFRDFRADGRGLRIWGARVMTSDTSWKYINVRRLFLFIEESIDEGTQWVVFEPNDEPLWARVRQSITTFLTRVWRDGALQGATPEEAFFVKCDRTTMTQTDLDNGKLICLVGVAPVKPAEFVIIRISQFTASAEA